MKLEKIEREIESIGFDDDESIVASIDVEDLAFIFRNLTEIYSRPIDSISREITSNCFDSHKDAGTNKPVIIGFSKDADYQEYVYFKDQGTGLSHEEMKSVYMKYGKSKRRKDNEMHGAFGIGSKSPLSYTDQFYIDSVKDGIKTEYTFYIGEDDMPRLDPLNSFETDENNGVEIKIQLKDSYDKLKFIDAFIKELKYFDNVYFKDCEYGGKKVENNYKIYEYRTFKLRDDFIRSHLNGELHICYGKASYKIDFEKLNRWGRRIFIPVGLKIPMGLLKPTKERENITYTDEAIEVIDNAITEMMNELEKLYEEQTKTLNDLFEYQKLRKQKGCIKIDENLELNTSDYFNKKQYKYHLDYNLPQSISEIFSIFFVVPFKIQDGRRLSKFTNYSLSDRLIRANVDYKNDIVKNKYISNGIIIRRNKKKLKTLYKEMIYHFKLEKLPYRERKEKIRLIYSDIMNQFNKNSESYLKITVPEEFIEENKAQRRTLDKNKLIVHKISKQHKKYWKKETTVKELRDYKGLIIYGAPDDEYKLKTIRKMFPQDKTMHKHKDAPYYFIYTSKTNQKYLDQLSLENNFINVKQFMEGKNRAFIRTATAHKLKKYLDGLDNYVIRKDDYMNNLKDKHYYRNHIEHESNFGIILKLLNQNVYEHFEAMKEYVNNAYTVTNKEFIDDIIEISEKNKLFDESIIHSLDTVKDYCKDLDILFNVHVNETSIKQIILYAKSLKKKLNLSHYMVLTEPYELELYEQKLLNDTYKKFIKENPDKNWKEVEDNLKQTLKLKIA